MFEKLQVIYPFDTVEFYVRNYFKFQDDLYQKRKQELDIKPLQNLLSSLDPDIQFILKTFLKMLISLIIIVELKRKNLNFI